MQIIVNVYFSFYCLEQIVNFECYGRNVFPKSWHSFQKKLRNAHQTSAWNTPQANWERAGCHEWLEKISAASFSPLWTTVRENNRAISGWRSSPQRTIAMYVVHNLIKSVTESGKNHCREAARPETNIEWPWPLIPRVPLRQKTKTITSKGWTTMLGEKSDVGKSSRGRQ